MKRILSFIAIAATTVFLLSVSGCRKTREREQEPDEEQKETSEKTSDKDKQTIGDLEFSYEFKAENGERTVSSVNKTPKASISIECNDDGTNFVLEYSINGGEKKKINKLWPGKGYSFDNVLLTATDYGLYKISGIIYEEDHPDTPLSVEKEVWMVYKKAEVKNIFVSSVTRTEAVGSSLSLYEEEEGDIVVEYGPDDTYLLIGATSSNPSVFSLNASAATNVGGVYKIPFTAAQKGSVNMDLVFTNGPQETTKNVKIDVVEDTEGKSFSLDATCDEFSMPGYDIQVNVSASGGKKDQKFNLEFFIDDTPSGTQNNITINQVTGKMFSVDNLSVGDHALKVKLTASDKPEYFKEKVMTFTVCTPRLLVTLGADSQLLVNGGSAEVNVSKTYTLQADGVPVKYKDRISIMSMRDSDSVSGFWPWSFVAGRHGYGDIKMRVTLERNRTAELLFHFLRKDTCELQLEYVYETTQKDRPMVSECAIYLKCLSDRFTTSTFNVWASVAYYGECEYLVGNNPAKEDIPENEQKVKTTDTYTSIFQKNSLSISSRQLFAELLYTASTIEDMTVESGYWYTTSSGEVWPDWIEGEFYYHFNISRVSLKLNLSGNDGDGLSFLVHLKGISRYLVSSESGNISFAQ